MLTEFGKPFIVNSDSPMPDLEEVAPVKIKAESGMVVSPRQQAASLESTWEWLRSFASGLVILEKEGSFSPISNYSEDSAPDYSNSSPTTQESISDLPSLPFI